MQIDVGVIPTFRYRLIMFSFEECREIAKTFIAKKNESNKAYWMRLKMLDTHVELTISDRSEESKYCFAFFCTAKKYLDSSKHGQNFIGPGPLIVDRRNGEVIETGSGYSRETYLENYEKRGDYREDAGKTVRIFTELCDANRLFAIKAVRARTMLGLKESKEGVDRLARGEFFDVDAKSMEDAVFLVEELILQNYTAERL